MEKLKRFKEEEERKIAEKRQQKEIEWYKRELVNKEPAFWLQWPEYVYEINPKMSEFSVGCVIRAQSNNFNPSCLRCDVVKQLQNTFTYEHQEELVSFIIQITPSNIFTNVDKPLFIAIPHFTSRASVITREVFIKMKKGSCWCEVPTTEVIIDSHKDIKFAQTMLTVPAMYVVVTRLKRDYITLTTMPAKVVSSYDQRITLSIQGDSFSQNEHLLLSGQPVDSASVTELRRHGNSLKGLLSSSPIILTEWESTQFARPILVTLPCPPNPAKVKRLAAIRAQREERAKNPKRALLEDAEQDRKRKQKETNSRSYTGKTSGYEKQTAEEECLTHADEKRSNPRWYMGIYASNDDDENDQLYFVACSGSKIWAVVKDIAVTQIKLDLLQLELLRPYSKFMVLRTRVTVDEEQAANMSTEIEKYLSKRLVQVIVKQNIWNYLQVTLHMVPVTKVTCTINKLKELDFMNGPENSPVITVKEGEVMEISFRGNLKNTRPESNHFVYNSNLKSSVEFTILEVDRYLQKNFPVFRGFLRLFRRNLLLPDVKKKAKSDEENQELPEIEPETRLELLTEILLTIPKTHIQPNPVPIRAQVVIRNRDDPVNEILMQQLAIELGDEWRRLSQYLDISQIRLQAIWRNAKASDYNEEQARYEMLITWLKTLPKCVDKISVLSGALNRCGRPDLTTDLRLRNLVFQQQKDIRKQQMFRNTYI